MDILIEEGERNMFAIENSMQANPYGRSSLNQNSQVGIPYQYNQSFQGTNNQNNYNYQPHNSALIGYNHQVINDNNSYNMY
jgi:hypothetical protein